MNGLQVRKTMHAIRYTLIERWYAFEDAIKLSKSDPEIDWTILDPRPIFEPKEDSYDGELSEQSFLEEDVHSVDQGSLKSAQVNAA